MSIPANIAEGFVKRGKADKARFLNIAQGSLQETKYYLISARDLEYAETESYILNSDEIGKMLNAYASSILNS